MLSIKSRSYYYLHTIKDTHRIMKVHNINKDYIHVFRNQLAFCRSAQDSFLSRKSKYYILKTYYLSTTFDV